MSNLIEGKNHRVYKNDPLKEKELVNHVVEITRRDGSKCTGTIFTVDPVSESVVLANKCNGAISIDIIMGHAVESKEILPDVEPTILDALFPSSNPAASMSAETISNKRRQVISWLSKNRVPVEQDGDLIVLEKALQIHPPYEKEQCVSDNEIILGKIQELIMTMPTDFI